MKVFDIKKEFNTLYEMMENDSFEVNDETGEVIDNSELLLEMMAELEVTRDEKLNNIEYIKRELATTRDALKAESTRILARAKSLDSNIEKLKNLQDFILSGEKCKTDLFTFSYRSSTSVEILDENLIPAEFLNVKETFTPDKNKIKEALNNFESVAGVKLVTKTNLGVK